MTLRSEKFSIYLVTSPIWVRMIEGRIRVYGKERILDSIEAMQIPQNRLESDPCPVLLQIRSDGYLKDIYMIVPFPRFYKTSEQEDPEILKALNTANIKIRSELPEGLPLEIYGKVLTERTYAPTVAGVINFTEKRR